MAKKVLVKGIEIPYGTSRSAPKRITSSTIRTEFRNALGEPHISLGVSLVQFPGPPDPIGVCVDKVRHHRFFIDAGLAGRPGFVGPPRGAHPRTLSDFEGYIETWFSGHKYTVIKD